MSEHELKCWPPFFAAILAGDKPFEIRKDDRAFQRGDMLVLREWGPDAHGALRYSGRALSARVTFVLRGGQFGLDAEYVAMGLADVKERRMQSERAE